MVSDEWSKLGDRGVNRGGSFIYLGSSYALDSQEREDKLRVILKDEAKRRSQTRSAGSCWINIWKKGGSNNCGRTAKAKDMKVITVNLTVLLAAINNICFKKEGTRKRKEQVNHGKVAMLKACPRTSGSSVEIRKKEDRCMEGRPHCS